jgi:nitrogen fixation NifU-like protein
MNKPKEPGFDFWNDHSLEFLEMAMKRDFQERLTKRDGYGTKTRECGDKLEVFVTLKGNQIDTISYDLKGCIFSHACINTLIHLIQDRSIREAKKISCQDIVTIP